MSDIIDTRDKDSSSRFNRSSRFNGLNDMKRLKPCETVETVRAVACRNPFTMGRVDYVFPEGLTLKEVLDTVALPAHVAAVVSVNGDPISPGLYGETVLRKDDFVSIRAVPTGGDGKNIARAVLGIAILIGAWYAAPFVVGSLGGFGGIGFGSAGWAALGAAGASGWAMAAMAGLGIVGQLGLNALCPPAPMGSSHSAQTYKDSPTYSLTAAGNALNPYGPIPSLLGTYRIYPPYGARPYTEVVGDDQYLHMLFNLGHGPIQITNLKLGETPLADFANVEVEIIDGSVTQDTTLFPEDVYQEDLSVALTQEGGWQYRTTQTNTSRISADFTWANGLLQVLDDGTRADREVEVEMQISAHGQDDWKGAAGNTSVASQDLTAPERDYGATTWHMVLLNKTTGEASLQTQSWTDQAPDWAYPLASVDVEHSYNWYTYEYYTEIITITDKRPAEFVSAGYFQVTNPSGSILRVGAGVITNHYIATGKTTSAVRRTYSLPVESGQYDVRCRRITEDSDNLQISDKVWWTALRSGQGGAPVTEPNIAKVALKIKATEQLNGVVDDFNCEATVLCPDYEYAEEGWLVRATSNPASLYRYVLQGPANKRPLTDAQIDLDILEEWHDRCRLNGWTFNHYVDYRGSVDDLLRMIAAAGRATPGYVDGKYAVVMDKPQVNPAFHLTPRNSWGYTYSKTFVKLPHAFRVRFYNKAKGWKEDERVVYDDGYSDLNATEFEELSLPGIDDADLAWSHARYHIATARLRPDTHVVNCDFGHVTFVRGQMGHLAHDVIEVGLAQGRIKAYTDDETNILTITLDEEMPMASGKTYGLRIRKQDGTSLALTLATVVGTSNTVTLTSVLPIASAPDIGSLAMYGEAGEESIEVICSRIEPGKDLTARITCLAAAPEVHNADVGPIPEFESHITDPVDRWQLYVPIIGAVRADETVVRWTEQGLPVSRILVSFAPQALPSGAIDRIQARYYITNTQNPYTYAETTSLGEIALEEGIMAGETYTLQARFQIDGKWGQWCATEQVTVSRQPATLPATPTGVSVDFTGADCLFQWDAASVELAFSHYLLTVDGYDKKITDRASPSYVYTFNENKVDHSGTPSPALPYALSVVDVYGNQSISATGTAENPAPLSFGGMILADPQAVTGVTVEDAGVTVGIGGAVTCDVLVTWEDRPEDEQIKDYTVIYDEA